MSGHGDSDRTARALEAPEHFGCLVRRNASTNSERNLFSGERVFEGVLGHNDLPKYLDQCNIAETTTQWRLWRELVQFGPFPIKENNYTIKRAQIHGHLAIGSHLFPERYAGGFFRS
jgi:hypothetical protein